MMDIFTIFDLGFLVAFGLFVIIFLYTRKKNLKREGLMYLYRTSWGLKLIDYVGTKYKRTLSFLSYVSVGLGYILMGTMVYFLGKIVYIYIAFPQVVRTIKVPPIMPLIPYLPQMFKLDFLPPFYFTYWIVIIAIIAITHEFAHGIFARHAGVKVKATGFGFLGPFLAAFVEPDEEHMEKKSIFSQLSILSAGTFANVLTAIFFLGVLWIFFITCFTASGVVFDTYSYSPVELSSIIAVNGIAIEGATYDKVLNSINGGKFDKIETTGGDYLATRDILEQQTGDENYLILYDDAPAINAGLGKVIVEINDIKTNSLDSLKMELEKYSVGETIKVETKTDEGVKEFEVVLEKNPEKDSVWLGIGFSNPERKGILGRMYVALSSFKEEHVDYEPKWVGGTFIFDLLWWVILISISVALVNMLPIGIFDGGRVFYLTILAITKSDAKAKSAFKWLTYLFLVLLVVLMVYWGVSFFR